MQTVRFVLAHVLGRTGVSDLSSALIGISGVGQVAIDPTGQACNVEFDPYYVNARMICGSIEGAGYPVSEMGEIQQ